MSGRYLAGHQHYRCGICRKRGHNRKGCPDSFPDLNPDLTWCAWCGAVLVKGKRYFCKRDCREDYEDDRRLEKLEAQGALT